MSMSQRFSLNDALEVFKRTGNIDDVKEYWTRERLVIMHDQIQDFLDDLPAGVSNTTVAKLEDSLSGLRADLARIVTA